MAKNNVGKKPISQEEYTTNKVLAVFSVCLLGVLVLMILERLLGYSNTWKTGVLVTRVLLGVGIVGAAPASSCWDRSMQASAAACAASCADAIC